MQEGRRFSFPFFLRKMNATGTACTELQPLRSTCVHAALEGTTGKLANGREELSGYPGRQQPLLRALLLASSAALQQHAAAVVRVDRAAAAGWGHSLHHAAATAKPRDCMPAAGQPIHVRMTKGEPQLGSSTVQPELQPTATDVLSQFGSAPLHNADHMLVEERTQTVSACLRSVSRQNTLGGHKTSPPPTNTHTHTHRVGGLRTASSRCQVCRGPLYTKDV